MAHPDAWLSWELLLLAALACLLLGQWPPAARAAPVFTAEPMIVSQDLLSGVCTDSTGSQRLDLDEWTTSVGSCDNVVCHVEPSGNYTVTHSCRPLEPNENPDSTNCQWVTDTSLTYPDCCPQLSCGVASVPTTINPLSCFDLANNYTCVTWQSETNNCTDTAHVSYNFSQVFCRSTCGLC